MNAVHCRSRKHYGAFLFVTIILGLPTRLWPQALPPFLVNYGGDALWALAIFLLLSLLLPGARTRTLTLVAFAVTWGIEFSELYQADWINAIRATRLGGLVLGFTFLPSDLLCYSVGIAAGFLIDRFVYNRSVFHESKDDFTGANRGQKPFLPPD